jgi:hypothetical protein
LEGNGNQIKNGKEDFTYVQNLQHYRGHYAEVLQYYIYSGITPWRTPEYFE